MTATTLSFAGPISTSGSPRWRGQWIAPEARPALDVVEASLGASTARWEFCRSIFRKAFQITEIPQGTIADVPEWNLVDWSSIFLTGRSSILTGLWARSLGEFAELAEATANPGGSQWARNLHAAAAIGYEDFWDAERSVYVDHIIDGARQRAASQAAGAAAILSGLAPRERWTPIAEAITDPERLVVRSWIGSETGGYNLQKMREQAHGIQRIDWDTGRQIVLAEPFFSYAVHDAVAKAGHAPRLIDLMQRWHEFLVDGYDTFGECWGWGTPVHGWSSTPTRDPVVHVLGISPDAPGYAKARITPRLGRLREAAGAVPTPHGTLEIRITGNDAWLFGDAATRGAAGVRTGTGCSSAKGGVNTAIPKDEFH